MDIVESVSPTIPENFEPIEDESEDEDEKMARIKQEIKEKTMGVLNLLCVWDCANIWIKISEVLSFLVFDPFTGKFFSEAMIFRVHILFFF